MRAVGRLFVLSSWLVAGCASKAEPAGGSPDAGATTASPRAQREAPTTDGASPLAALQRHAAFAGSLGRGGALEPIGGALRARDVDESKGGLRARLPSTSAGTLRLESGKDAGAWAAIRALDLNDVAGALDEGAIVFREASREAKGVDVVLASDGVRAEELRVHRVASAAIDARWRVDVGPAITTARAREGRFELVDRGGYVHLQTAPIVALDADDRALAVTLEVAPAGPSAYELHVHVDTAHASWPVALDPGWAAVAPMTYARRYHHATTLDNGKVLVVGGNTPNASNAELYDPAANTWSAAGTIDPTTLNGRLQGLFPIFNHQALLVGSDVCTSTKLACGKLSGRTCVQIQHFTGGTTWKTVAKIGPLPDAGALAQLPDGKLVMTGKADDCAANQGLVAATFDETSVTYLPTAKIFNWDPANGIAVDSGGRVLFPVKGAPSWWLDASSGAWTQGPPSPTQGTVALDMRGVFPLATGKILGLFTAPSVAVAATLAPGGTTWDPTFPCDFEPRLADIGVREGRTGARVALGSDGSIVSAYKFDFYRAAATGCTHIRYPSGLFLPDGTASVLPDGRMLISGGSQLPGSGAIISTAGLPNGAACKDPALCGSGLCVSGVCCDQACLGTCMSCRAGDTGGAEGSCLPRANGVRDTRCTDAYSPALAAKTYTGICALADGTCDGAGTCRTKALADRSCGTSSCIGDQLNGPKCDGAGNCQAVSTKPCEPFACDGTAGSCKTTCTTATDCTSASYCGTDGTCAPKKPNGQACAADGECASAACVDSYCCSAPCTGQCQACDVTGHEGSCWPVDGAPHGARTACDGSGPCGGACKGATSTTECAYPSATTDCGTTCENGSYAESTCDGHGACATKAPINCGAYKCDGGAPGRCLQSCAGNDACSTGYVCSSGACIPEPKPACSADGTQSTNGLGAITPCGAYRCDAAAGTCRTTCAASDECGAGYICDGARTCVPKPEDSGADSGGCTTGARSAPGAALALLLAGGVAALLRARRRG